MVNYDETEELAKALVYKDGVYEYINTQGNKVEDDGYFYKYVKKDDKYVFVNNSGEEVAVYDFIFKYS